MVRRIIFIAAGVVAMIPLMSGSASAFARIDGAFHGAFAEAQWTTSSTSSGNSLVSREQDGTTHLSVHQFFNVAYNDEGEVISGTVIQGETIKDVTFVIDTVHYTFASVHGEIPVSSCTLVGGQPMNCVDAGIVRYDAHWEGIGPIPHDPDTELSWPEDCLFVDRNSSIEREATLTVELSLNGETIPATPSGFAGFGKGNSRVIIACP